LLFIYYIQSSAVECTQDDNYKINSGCKLGDYLFRISKGTVLEFGPFDTTKTLSDCIMNTTTKKYDNNCFKNTNNGVAMLRPIMIMELGLPNYGRHTLNE
jgi:hypothetical protein